MKAEDFSPNNLTLTLLLMMPMFANYKSYSLTEKDLKRKENLT